MASADFLAGQLRLDLREAFAHETARAVELGGRHLRDIVTAYRDGVKSSAGIAEVNQEIAATMRVAVLDAYKTNVLDVRSAPPYRKGDRHSGALLTALESPTMAVGDADGITLGDGRLLDQVAEHWARLNFGASPGEGFSGVQFPPVRRRIQFGKNQGFTLEFTGFESPPFRIPEDPAFSGHFRSNGTFWIGYPPKTDENGDPIDRKTTPVLKGKLSHGIGARHFLDAGITAFADNFKPMYQAYFKRVADQAEGNA